MDELYNKLYNINMNNHNRDFWSKYVLILYSVTKYFLITICLLFYIHTWLCVYIYICFCYTLFCFVYIIKTSTICLKKHTSTWIYVLHFTYMHLLFENIIWFIFRKWVSIILNLHITNKLILSIIVIVNNIYIYKDH